MSDFHIKIKRAEKNFDLVFAALKKILEKPNDDSLFKGSSVTVQEAKAAQKDKKFISFMYSAFTDKAADSVSKAEFLGFVKKQMRTLSDIKAFDMYMLVGKRLN